MKIKGCLDQHSVLIVVIVYNDIVMFIVKSTSSIWIYSILLLVFSAFTSLSSTVWIITHPFHSLIIHTPLSFSAWHFSQCISVSLMKKLWNTETQAMKFSLLNSLKSELIFTKSGDSQSAYSNLCCLGL